MLEVLTDYQTENTFNVSLWNPAVGPVDQPRAGKGADAFVIKEVSSCCQRQFCGPNRAFDIAMVPSSPLIATFHPGLENRETMFRHPDALVMRRPFTCTCCCYNRCVRVRRGASCRGVEQGTRAGDAARQCTRPRHMLALFR
jgi:hypothetical protein